MASRMMFSKGAPWTRIGGISRVLALVTLVSIAMGGGACVEEPTTPSVGSPAAPPASAPSVPAVENIPEAPLSCDDACSAQCHKCESEAQVKWTTKVYTAHDETRLECAVRPTGSDCRDDLANVANYDAQQQGYYEQEAKGCRLVRGSCWKDCCLAGQVVNEDTHGHCCWGGQVWVDGRQCVGMPSCPADMTQAGTECLCPDGNHIGPNTQGHCCAESEVWSTVEKRCVG